MSENVINITSSKNFDDIISEKKCVIDFWANWCMPCKALEPIFEELASMYKDLVFMKVNVEENHDISSKYLVTSLPAIFFLDKGKVVSQIIGNVDKRKIVAEIEKL